eukprot:403354388
MFGGGNRFQSPKFEAQESSLNIRPYNQQLNTFTKKICDEFGLGGNDVCMFETRTAFDCVLRHKVQKMGAITDNLGACIQHINNMKENVGKSYKGQADISQALDNYLNEVNYMRKSFV